MLGLGTRRRQEFTNRTIYRTYIGLSACVRLRRRRHSDGVDKSTKQIQNLRKRELHQLQL